MTSFKLLGTAICLVSWSMSATAGGIKPDLESTGLETCITSDFLRSKPSASFVLKDSDGSTCTLLSHWPATPWGKPQNLQEFTLFSELPKKIQGSIASFLSVPIQKKLRLGSDKDLAGFIWTELILKNPDIQWKPRTRDDWKGIQNLRISHADINLRQLAKTDRHFQDGTPLSQSLRTLIMTKQNLSNEEFKALNLFALKNLTSLTVADNFLSEESAQIISQLPLTHLNIAKNSFFYPGYSKGVDWIVAMKGLTQLDVSANELSAKEVLKFSTMLNLCELDISGHTFTPEEKDTIQKALGWRATLKIDPPLSSSEHNWPINLSRYPSNSIPDQTVSQSHGRWVCSHKGRTVSTAN